MPTLSADTLGPAPVSVRPALALEVGSPAEQEASGQLAEPGRDVHLAEILRVERTTVPGQHTGMLGMAGPVGRLAGWPGSSFPTRLSGVEACRSTGVATAAS